MQKFTRFLSERTHLDDKAMTPQGMRHVTKYIENWKGKNEYEVAKAHDTLQPGTKVQIHGTHVVDGRTHAIVTHGDSTEKVSIPLRKLYKPSEKVEVRKKEDAQVSQIHNELERVKQETGKDHVVIIHNGQEHHITHVEQVPGNPKADAILHDKTGKHLYFSLKDGSKPTDIHGYGGVTKATGLDKSPTVHKFAGYVAKHFPGGVTKATPGHILNSSNEDHAHIIKTSVYGKDYANKEHGINNVHGVLQGHVTLAPHKDKKEAYELNAHHVIVNDGKTPPGEYQLHARAQSDRSLSIGEHNIPYTRVFVAPVGARKITHKME